MRYILETILKKLGYPVALQGSYELDGIPDDVITYRIADASDTRRYNNRPALTGYYIQVNFYSRKMSKLDAVAEQISDTLLDAGFTRAGEPIDAGYDKDTGHYGVLMDYYYLKRKEV